VCQYNDNQPLDLDTAEALFDELLVDMISWDNCECLPTDTPACQPPLEQWEEDFVTCDVTKTEAGAKVAGQDDSLCPEEIESCFDNLCDKYLCTPESCDCD
jgi:hypothetical protein